MKKEFDSDGLLLCELQGKAFELSLSQMETSSEVFIRRYMYSSAAKLLDNGMALIRITLPQDLLDFVNEQYGISSYGSGELPPLIEVGASCFAENCGCGSPSYILSTGL